MKDSTFKRFAIFTIVLLFSLLGDLPAATKTNQSYVELWKQIDSLLQIQQPESAFKVLEVVYMKSKSEFSQIQQIKAFVGIEQIKLETSDEVVSYPFTVWEKEMLSLKPENRSVLLAYQGEFMVQIFNRNRGEIYQRTKGAAQPNDVATWDVAYFKSRVDSCFLKSLDNHEILAKISSKEYIALLDTVELAWQYRPTLLDLVAAKALEFYRNDGFDLSPIPLAWAKDANQFSERFVPKSFENGRFDSRIFAIFKLLENHHLKIGEAYALLHLKLDRLNYIYESSSLPSKDELFIEALKVFDNQVGNNPFEAEILEKHADVLSVMAKRYEPKNPVSEIYRMKNKEAAEIYQSVILLYPNTSASIRSVNKLRQLQQPQLQLTLENIGRKGFPFAASVQYSNLATIKAKLYKINQSEYLAALKSDLYGRRFVNQKFKSEKLISEQNYQLVKDEDLRNHSTELIFPKLNSGLYRIKIEGITGNDTCNSSALFTVSGISFSGVDRKLNVMDIENGAPVKGAVVEIFDRENQDWNTGKFHSADDGIVKVKGECDIVRVVFEADTVTMPWNIRMNPDYGHAASQQLYMITDRSIYRPGQTVFFKGILFDKNEYATKAIEKQSVEIVFRNSNYQSIDTLKLTSNRFGTVSGKFRIPSDGLAGNFQLTSDKGSVNFRVEEYRRPGFKIEVDDLKGEYRLNSQVEVTGNVTSFSGVPLNNVTGKYRISRNQVWAWRSFGEAEQISEGTFTTDNDGKYLINFVAKPDERSSETATYPFRFEVEIEVTDITGETQTATKSLNIAKEALTVSIDGPAIFDLVNSVKKEAFNITFKVINSDNQEIKSSGKIELILLKSPQLPLRKRQWMNPDRPIYSKTAWDQLFPGNLYGDEILPINYDEDKVIQTIDFVKQDTSLANFNTTKLEQGYYKVRISTTDKFGASVKAEHLIRVYDSTKKVFLFPESSWVNLSKTSALPGESIELLLGNFGKQFWNVQLHRKVGAITLFNGLVEKTMEKISIPVAVTDQGGLMISVSTMNQGISYYEVFNVDVPWIQKELKLSVEDFPKSVIPGKEVSWKVRVLDSEGKPVKAEIAGVVYDASLDKILPYDWQLSLWENSIYFQQVRFPGIITWGVGHCTQPVRITEKPEVLPEFSKIIDYQTYNVRRFLNSRQDGVMMKSAAIAEPLMASDALMGKVTFREDKDSETIHIRGNSSQKLEGKPTEIRSDFRETAWFNAHFETDEAGRAEVHFNLPESVTEWKFMALAHTPEGLSGTITDKFVTQKQLMVEPFPTRFLTVGDEVTFPVKVTNLSGKPLSLEVKMELINMETGKIIVAASKSAKLTLSDAKSDAVNWQLSAPTEPGLYQIRVTALGDGYSDGFKSILPVEPDRKWTTESKAFTVKPGSDFKFDFNKLGGVNQINEGNWNLSIMTNPLGLILDALPQLIGSESFTISGVASRLNGSLILRKILTDHPEIAKELELQRSKLVNSPDSFKTRLEKAEQFTNLKLNETPWLQESLYEKEKLAKFNPDTIKVTISESIDRLDLAQLSDGGFAWCPGMESSEWITVHILSDIAQMRLKKLLSESERARMMAIAIKAVSYLDLKITKDFRQLKDKEKIICQPDGYIIDYLFARSAFKDFEYASGAKESYNFFLEKASKNWTKTGIWQQVQLAFVLKRESNEKLLQVIVKSIEERAIKNNELGMYWKQSGSLWFYREPDISLQSRMIELFGAINAPIEKTDAMKLWLLQQKRTHAWDSPSSTSMAVYALMSGHDESIGNQTLPKFFLDGKKIDLERSKSIDGFVQLAFDQKDINSDSKLEINNSGKNILFGGLYHGYFKQMNDTSRFESSLKIRKEIYKIERSASGDSLTSNLIDSRPGDLLMVRLLIENDRDLGFVSLDDQRPAGTEPLKQLSEYEYNGGLWYYRVNADTGTRFFIGNLPKGRFVLEYPVRVSHLGTFSGGRANIQCSFAPEFGANHSPGKVNFESK